jgi:hypothetical protein
MDLPGWIAENYKTIVFVFVVAILVYLAYVLWWSGGSDTGVEGFAPHELTDLLDKIRVGIYDNQSVWNNRFYNNQPERKEKPLSFWLPQLTDGSSLPSGYKVLGTCVSDKTNYDSPAETTMLIKGDVKAPTGANDVFTFPHNEITRPRLDKRGQPVTRFVLKDIKELSDIDTRITDVETYLSDITKLYDEIKSSFEIAESEIDKNLQFSLVAYGPESYFKSALYTTKIKPGETITIPTGTYQSMRVPVGSSGTLVFEDGHTETFSYPYSGILDPSNPEKYKYEDTNKQLTYVDVVESGADMQRWMITGDYGLGFRRGNTSNIYYYDKQTISSMKYSMATSNNYGFGDMQTDTENKGIYGYGKSDLVDYFAKFYKSDTSTTNKNPTEKKTQPSDIISPSVVYLGKLRNENYPSYYFVLGDNNSKKVHSFNNKKTNEQIDLDGQNKTIESPHLYVDDTSRISGFTDVVNNLTNIDTIKQKFTNDNTWFAPDVDGKAVLDNSLTSTFTARKVYMDLAFRMHVVKKRFRTDGLDCRFGDLCNCCEIYDDKWVGLVGGGADHGPVVSATVTCDINTQQIPFYRKYNTISSNITTYIDGEIAAAYKQLAQLYDFKTLMNNNGLEPFPLRILRPSAPAGYVSLGDVLFNHTDPGYTAKLPIVDRFACVPEQCTREMREWLITDKVYEYNRDGKYLAIYKNPYLQTFRATTVAGVLPPGKVNKVVACVEKCQLVDEILGADKCARKFYNSNKAVIESTNLDNDNVVLSRESAIYQDKIRERQDKITELQDVARKLQVQDDKAELVNREYNRNKLQNLVGKQQANIAHLGQRLKQEQAQVDINLKFDYAKFMELLYKIEVLPQEVKNKIIDIVDTRAGEKLEALPDDVVNAVLAECPTPESQGLVRKSLVESGCYGCADLQ